MWTMKVDCELTLPVDVTEMVTQEVSDVIDIKKEKSQDVRLVITVVCNPW